MTTEQLITPELVAEIRASYGLSTAGRYFDMDVKDGQDIERKEGFCAAERHLVLAAQGEADYNEADGREAAAYEAAAYGSRY